MHVFSEYAELVTFASTYRYLPAIYIIIMIIIIYRAINCTPRVNVCDHDVVPNLRNPAKFGGGAVLAKTVIANPCVRAIIYKWVSRKCFSTRFSKLESQLRATD